MTVSCATFCQPASAPESDGAAGAVRSMRAVPVTQLLVRPEASNARKRTNVSPSAVTVRVPDVDVAPQVRPPSVEIWRW